MNSEKVKEIKKAMGHCGEKVTCKGCPENNNEPVIDWFKCRKNLLQKTITLINELESDKKTILESKTMWKRLHTELCEENQELKDRIAELEKENGELKQHITEVEKGIINIAKERNKKDELASKFIDSYNDSLKQFAERLKEKLKARHGANRLLLMPVRDVVLSMIEGLLEDVDKTLKEFINE